MKKSTHLDIFWESCNFYKVILTLNKSKFETSHLQACLVRLLCPPRPPRTPILEDFTSSLQACFVRVSSKKGWPPAHRSRLRVVISSQKQKRSLSLSLYIYIYYMYKMSWEISCGFQILVKLGSCPNDFQNHTITVTFFKKWFQTSTFSIRPFRRTTSFEIKLWARHILRIL